MIRAVEVPQSMRAEDFEEVDEGVYGRQRYADAVESS